MDLRKNVFFGLAALLLVGSFVITTGDLAPYALVLQLGSALAVCAGLIQRDTLQGVTATAVACLGFNYYLFQSKMDAAAGPSACNIDATFNCDVVNSSSYSTIEFGTLVLPVTLIGAAFYAGLAFAALQAPTGDDDDGKFHQVNTLFAGVSVLYSLYLAWASTQIGAVCIVCISIYVGNALLLWAGLRGLGQTGRSFGEGLGSIPFSKPFMTVSVVFLVVLALGQNTYEEATKLPDIRTTGQNSGADKSPGALLATLYKRPDGPVGFDGDEPLLGDSEAPYQIVEFADFGCPHCARAKEEFHQLVQANPDVAVRFRYFPLSGACNPVLPEGGTAERCNAAAAAECAHQQGKFWEMADQLFQNMGYFEPEQLAYMAGELGLDLPKWEACMAAPETMETLARNGRAGGEAGVQGTPAIFLKGVVPGTYVSVTRGPEAVLKLIEAHRDGIKLPAPKN